MKRTQYLEGSLTHSHKANAATKLMLTNCFLETGVPQLRESGDLQ